MSAFLRLGPRAGSRGIQLDNCPEEKVGEEVVGLSTDEVSPMPISTPGSSARANVSTLPLPAANINTSAPRRSGMGTRRRPPSIVVDTGDFGAAALRHDRGSMPVESISMNPTDFDRKECSRGSSGMYWSRALRGARRRLCEDVVASHPELVGEWSSLGLFCLFDGHGGATAAEFASKAVVTHFLHAMRHRENPNEYIPDALRRAILDTDHDITNAAAEAGGSAVTCGTTAVIAAVAQGRLFLAHVGDSRAAVVSRKNPLTNTTNCRFLTRDHKPLNPDEIVRIETMGGFVLNSRVNGVLAVSRALGDQELKPYVSAEPDVLEMDITEEDELLILGSDGLWDFVTKEKAAEIVVRYDMDPERCSRALIEEAWTRSPDDISVIIIHLHRYLERLDAGGLMDMTGDDTGELENNDISSANF